MPDPLNIQAELAAMGAMTPKQLREKYLAVFGEPTRSGNRRFLIKRISWRIQADAEGDLPERIRQKALGLARDGDLRLTAPKSPVGQIGVGPTVERSARLNGSSHLAVGTQLTRAYKGQTVVVTVLADGFEYGGTRFHSLSAAAKAVTGSHTSGPRFFGLTQPQSKEATA